MAIKKVWECFSMKALWTIVALLVIVMLILIFGIPLCTGLWIGEKLGTILSVWIVKIATYIVAQPWLVEDYLSAFLAPSVAFGAVALVIYLITRKPSNSD